MNRNGTIKELNDQSLMVHAITKSNKICQQKCEHTPFMMDPLLKDFGYLANPKYANQVMQGTYNPPAGVSDEVIDFLEALRMPKSVKDSKK